MGILEEALARHGEELDGTLRGILVERGRSPLVERDLEPLPAGLDAVAPGLTVGRRQRRDTVDITVERIDEMGDLVHHHAPRAVTQPATIDHARPGEHEAASRPGFPHASLLPLQFAPTIQHRGPGHQVVARIDEHRPEPVKPLAAEAQRHDARLARDRHPDLVGDLEPPAALEPLLREEHGDPAAESLGLVLVEPLRLLHATTENVVPGPGKRQVTEGATTAGTHPGKQHGTRLTAIRRATAAAPVRGAFAGGTGRGP